jgi:hypothetical protein
MGWMVSIGVGLCAGIVGFVVTLFTAGWAVEWYRIPQGEGAAGYLVWGIAICVFFGAVVVGIVCARLVAQSASLVFLKALGISTSILFATVGIGLMLARLLADIPPRIEGRALELAIELRCPPGFAMPSLNEPSDAYATVLLLSSGDTRMRSRLEVEHSRTEAGRLIIPTLLGLDTGQSKKLLSIHLGKQPELLFPFDFAAKPGERDLQWSRWIEAAWPAEGKTFHMRYRVQMEPLRAKQLTAEEADAQRLAGIHFGGNRAAAWRPTTPFPTAPLKGSFK